MASLGRRPGNAALTSADIPDNSITAAKIVDATIAAGDLGPNSVDSSELVDGSVDLSHMSVNSVDSDQYVDGSIDLAHMSVNSIDSDQYVDGSIDLAHMSVNSIDSDQYVDGSIDLVHMSVNSIDSDQYVDGSIDLAHMSANSVDSDQYVDASIDTAHIGDDQVTGDKLANDIAISTTGAITTTGAFTSIGIDDNANALAITIDANENVGIGGTPSVNSWNTPLLQLGTTSHFIDGGNDTTQLSTNVYQDSGYKRIMASSVKPAAYQQNNGSHQFLTAAADTAGSAITWTTPMIITADSNIEMSGSVAQYTGGAGTVQKSSASGAATRTVTITGLHATSPGSHWDLVNVLVWRMGVDGGYGDNHSKHWRHHCNGLTTWSLGSATEVWGGTPDTCANGTNTVSQLQFTVAIPSDYSTLKVELIGYGMGSPKIVIT